MATAAHAQIDAVDPALATSFPNLGGLIQNVLAIVLFIAGLLAFVYLIIGGLQWITSGGDMKAAASARDKITSALVGMIIIVAAFAITLVLEKVFGICVIGGCTFPPADQFPLGNP